jgi:hypothetical protein
MPRIANGVKASYLSLISRLQEITDLILGGAGRCK